MKRNILLIIISLFLIQPSFGFDFSFFSKVDQNERAVKKVLNSQVRYANRGNFEKFIATYDNDYVNADGFDLKVYSKLVKDVWNSYFDVKYGIKIKNIEINNDTAKVELTEYSTAKLPLSKTFEGKLNSVSESIYYLKNKNNKWRVISDEVLDETSTMLYGDLMNVPVKLDVPLKVAPDSEYTASLELSAPENTVAIASITSEKIEYPQQRTQEVYRAVPEDNILERLFTANSDNQNEYIVASIGLTETNICDMSVKLSLTGFGYIVRRVNVVNKEIKEAANE